MNVSLVCEPIVQPIKTAITKTNFWIIFARSTSKQQQQALRNESEKFSAVDHDVDSSNGCAIGIAEKYRNGHIADAVARRTDH